MATYVMFTQMGANAGIKRFGEQDVAYTFKEFKQLNYGTITGKPVFRIINSDGLTPRQNIGALESVNLMKQKRIRNTKGRTCMDGIK